MEKAKCKMQCLSWACFWQIGPILGTRILGHVDLVRTKGFSLSDGSCNRAHLSLLKIITLLES